MKFSKHLAVVAVAIWATLTPIVTSAGPAVIRDAELEDIIQGYMTPLLQVAGIAPGDVRLILINQPDINAFVAGGMNIFVYTGLLRKAETPDEVIGVLAHEIGHIAGGHIARLGSALENASTQAIASAILGVAAAIASGRTDVGAAVTAGGQSSALRGVLAHTRTQESAADQAAFRYLEGTGQSVQGIVDMLKRLSDQELLSSRYQDPYVRTHPLSRDRLETAKAFLSRSQFKSAMRSTTDLERFRRIQAKLAAFIDPPSKTLSNYQNTGPIDRYARAIAHYRRGDLGQAIPLIDGLIASSPNDPFLHELKGQMLMENGRSTEAESSYNTALQLRPGDPAIMLPAATAILESRGDTAKAIQILQDVTFREPRNSSAWRQLGISYGKQGNIGEASVALAEAEMLNGQKDNAVFQAQRAQHHLPKGSAGWLRAEDILRALSPKNGNDDKK